MEQFENNIIQEDRITKTITKIGGNVMNFLGIIVLLIGIGIVFIIASVDEAKEIRAKNSVSGKLMTLWLEKNDNVFPESYTSMIEFEDRTYYFVAEEINENNEVVKWYWAYDGGFDYILKDYRYYVIVALTILINIVVAQINYTSSKNKAKESSEYKKTMKYLAESKDKIIHLIDYAGLFCEYKTNTLYENEIKNKVLYAGLRYSDYKKMNKEDIKQLAFWQRIRLFSIRFIKVNPLRIEDMLYEKGESSGIFKRISPLPKDEFSSNRDYIFKTIFKQIINTGASGLVASFGLVINNWVLGLSMASTVIMTWVFATFSGDYEVKNRQRQRLIGKASLCLEFEKIAPRLIKEEEERIAKEKAEELSIQKKQEVIIEKETTEIKVEPQIEVKVEPQVEVLEEKVIETSYERVVEW